MCSIVGFIARQDSGPNLNRLKKVIRANHERGQDAHGMAWIDANGRFQVYKRPGAFRDNLDVLNMVQSARVVVCHLRKTTQGCHKDNINNHPHPCDSGWFIHNGSVSNYPELVTSWGVMPSSDCDSEVLGLITGRINRGKSFQWETAINDVAQTDALSVMAVYDRPARLIVARRGKPLSYHKASEGFYFASIGKTFPRRGKTFKDNQIAEYAWTRNSGGNRVRTIKLVPYEPPAHLLKQWERQFVFGSQVRKNGNGNGKGKLITAASGGKVLLPREKALLEAELETSADGTQSASCYVPVKYRLQAIQREVEQARAAGEAARKIAKGEPACIDGTRFHFDEHDQIVVDECDGYCDDCELVDDCDYAAMLEKENRKPKCPVCDAIIGEYPDGRSCDCDRIMDWDDDPTPDDVVLCDPAQLDKLEGK
jgi:predicted glutamine amidotransferase